MLPFTLFAGAAMLLSVPATLAHATKPSSCIPGKRVTPKEQSKNFSKFIQTLYVDKNVSAALNEYALESYIQHNPSAVSGRQAAIDFLSPALPSWNITIRHQGFDNNTGWLHWKLEGFGTERYYAGVDVWRFEGGCIAEHWDVLQAAPPANRTNPLELV
jgi:predicted SnoaL-like aldol condensation-catalyzing enzyme